MARKSSKQVETIQSDICKLSLKPGDVLVLRGEFSGSELRSICSMPNVPRVPVVVLRGGQEIQSLNEYEMKKAGWQRIQKPTILNGF